MERNANLPALRSSIENNQISNSLVKAAPVICQTRYKRLIKDSPGARYFGYNAGSSNASLTDLCILSAVSAASAEYGSTTKIKSKFYDFSGAMMFHPWYREPESNLVVNIHRAVGTFNCGGGHIIDQLLVFFGLPFSSPSRGKFINPCSTIKGKVYLSLGVKSFTQGWQKEVIPYSRKVISRWLERRTDLTFSAKRHDNFVDLIEDIGSSEYYVGIPSGAMHLAAALSKKSIIILNGIHASQIDLPYRKINSPKNLMWLYPQNVHLHEMNEGLIRSLSVDNLDKSMEELSRESFDLE